MRLGLDRRTDNVCSFPGGLTWSLGWLAALLSSVFIELEKGDTGF